MLSDFEARHQGCHLFLLSHLSRRLSITGKDRDTASFWDIPSCFSVGSWFLRCLFWHCYKYFHAFSDTPWEPCKKWLYKSQLPSSQKHLKKKKKMMLSHWAVKKRRCAALFSDCCFIFFILVSFFLLSHGRKTVIAEALACRESVVPWVTLPVRTLIAAASHWFACFHPTMCWGCC